MSKACFICGEVEVVNAAGFGFLCQYEGKPVCDRCTAIIMQVQGPVSATVVRELRKVVAARLVAALGGEE